MATTRFIDTCGQPEKRARLEANENTADKLMQAAAQGDLEAVQWLVEHGASKETVNDKGQTPLFIAAESGRLEVVKWLTMNNAKVDHIDYYDQTPLMQAAEEGHLAVVQWLVEHDANVEQLDEYGESVLQAATDGNHSEVVKYLVKNGADVNKNSSWNGHFVPLSIACYRGYKDLVKWLVEEGHADVNKASPGRILDGITPLICACLQGYTEIVEFLIRNKADVNTPMNDGETPLHIAANKGYINIVILLVENGADVNQKINGKTPLQAAREGFPWSWRLAVVEWLENYELKRKKNIHAGLKKGGLPVEMRNMIANFDNDTEKLKKQVMALKGQAR